MFTPIIPNLISLNTLFGRHLFSGCVSVKQGFEIFILPEKPINNTSFPILLPRIFFSDSFNFPINSNKTVKRTEVSNLSYVILSNTLIYKKLFEANCSSESNNEYTSLKLKKKSK